MRDFLHGIKESFHSFGQFLFVIGGYAAFLFAIAVVANSCADIEDEQMENNLKDNAYDYVMENEYEYKRVRDAVWDIEGSYDEGYDNGYSDGYDEGYNEGLSEGYDDGYSVGHYEGYDEGYDDGVSE